MNKYILFLLLFCSCASTKKNKQKISKKEVSTTVFKTTEEISKKEINNFLMDRNINKDLLEVIQEEIIISKKIIDSAGVQITVPETTIKKTIFKKVKEQEVLKLDTGKIKNNTFKIIQQDSTAVDKSEETNIKTKESKNKGIVFIVISIIFVTLLIIVGKFIIKKTTIL